MTTVAPIAIAMAAVTLVIVAIVVIVALIIIVALVIIMAMIYGGKAA